MRNKLIIGLLALPLAALSFSALAADAAVGRWKTIDDETGKAKSIVEVYKTTNGTLAGKVVQLLNPDKPNPVCDKCSGANKNKPIEGMVILWNLKQDDASHWSGGTVLDPKKGKTYKSKIELSADGKQLDMSGCIAFICRAQTWVRE